MERRFIGIKELAVYLDLKEPTIKAWLYQGRLPFVKMGRLIKFDIREIDVWIAKQRSQSPRQFIN
jgi:excisionase family DNA binding protein